MRYNKESFVKALREKYDEPFEIIEFNGTSKKGIFKCGLCQKQYNFYRMGKLLSPDRKHLCLHCFGSQYIEEVLEIFSKRDDIIFEKTGYKDNLHKPTVIFKCKKCGNETEKPYVEFIKYPTCIHCGPNAKRRTKATIPLPQGFELLEEYEGQYTKKLVRHDCGFIFKIRPKDLITGHSYCPKCSKKASKGERKIMAFLDEENIDFIKEKTFSWAGKRRYDFYIPSLKLIIEYNGIQHYKEVPNFPITLSEQQEIDAWKKEKALQNGLKYLTISYLDYNHIEDILAQRLKENT